MTDRGVLCPAEVNLTEPERHQFEALPDAANEVLWTLRCELLAGHTGEDHYAEGQDTGDGGVWWIRWNDRETRAIVALPSCPVTQIRPDDVSPDLCLLFTDHPGRHTFIRGRQPDHLAEYIHQAERATRLATENPAAAGIAATLALAAAINRLAGDGPGTPKDARRG